MSTNKVDLIGRVGKDPEIRHTEKSTLATFTFATSEKYKNAKGELIEDTTWHNIVIWGKLAEVAEKYFKRGSFLHLEGKINNRSYETKEGEKRYISEIIVNNFDFLGGEKKEQSNDLPPDNDPEMPF